MYGVYGTVVNPCSDPETLCVQPPYGYGPTPGSFCQFCNYSFWEGTSGPHGIKQPVWSIPDWQIGLKVSILAAICLVGGVANLTIIIIILSNRLLRLQPTNMFMLNMALADFIMLTICSPLFLLKQKVIFTIYLPGYFFCYLSPYLLIVLFTVGSSSLSLITLIRLFAIAFDKPMVANVKEKCIYIIVVGLWLVGLASAYPTIQYRRWWYRGWSDQVEISCDDNKDRWEKWTYDLYYLLLQCFTVWIPNFIMIFSCGCVSFKLKRSVKMFPYLSEQSRIVRVRTQVIWMLFVMMIVNLVCWTPWWIYTLLYTNLGDIQMFHNLFPKTWFTTSGYFLHDFQHIIHDIKYYMIFLNSALNPLIYGYWNANMRKAFRLTFPWMFKKKPNYFLQKNLAENSRFQKYTFKKIVRQLSTSNKDGSLFTQKSKVVKKRKAHIVDAGHLGTFHEVVESKRVKTSQMFDKKAKDTPKRSSVWLVSNDVYMTQDSTKSTAFKFGSKKAEEASSLKTISSKGPFPAAAKAKVSFTGPSSPSSSVVRNVVTSAALNSCSENSNSFELHVDIHVKISSSADSNSASVVVPPVDTFVSPYQEAVSPNISTAVSTNKNSLAVIDSRSRKSSTASV